MDTQILETPRSLVTLPDKFKIPPHSIEAEQAVLGGLMLENQAWEYIADKIVVEDFYRPEHQKIFQIMFVLVGGEKPLDVITVSEELQKTNLLSEVGGLAYLGELAKNTPSAANIAAYADIVRERKILRDLISVGADISEAAFNPDGRVSAEIVDEAERKVFHIAEKGYRGGGPEVLRTIMARTMENIEARFSDPSLVTGIPSGFTDFDKLTMGLQPGELIIVAGRPSMGKTVLGMNIAEHAAMKTNKSVLVFSMEMPGHQIAMRLMASMSRIELNKLRTGKLSEVDWTRLSSSVSMLSDVNMFIDETAALTPVEIRAKARRVARNRKNPLGLIVVDYLQLMRTNSYTENRATEISEISRALKALAKELNVPVVALSQLNRSLEQRPNKRPIMSDLRESGAIEQDADLIVFIYRDEIYNPDSPDKGTAEIIVAKHRNGSIGSVRLTFLGHYTRFDNYSHDTVIMPG